MEGFRMSPQQARLWSLGSGADPGTYSARCVVRIAGALDRNVLEDALAATVQRHELLRTALARLPEMTVPLQVIGADGRVALEHLDRSGMADTRRDEALAAIVDATCTSAWDAAEGPIVRVTNVRLAPDRHALVIGCPALWADTRGLRNLVAELARAYAERGQGGAGDREPLQYADLAEWQCELLEAPTSELGREYWRRQTPDRATRSRLPLWTTPAAGTRFVTARRNCDVAGLARAVADSAAAAAVAPGAVVLAAWQALIHRLSGIDRVVMGYTCDGRSYEELHDALGLVARDVPLACEFDAATGFLAAARRADAAIIAAERWQECFGWSEVAGDSPAAHYFPIVFEYRSQVEPLTIAELTWSVTEEYCCHDRFDLRLVVTGGGGTLSAALDYDPAVLDADAVDRMAESFTTLLADATTRPEAELADLQVIGAAERERIASALSPPADAQPEECVHHVIERQARAKPTAVALEDEHGSLSYAALIERADRLAGRLCAAGVGAESNVVLCLERSVDLIVGMLAILKAGGAYVPVDPVLPAARQRYIADDCGATVAVTRPDLAGAISGQGRTVIDIDAKDAETAPIGNSATPAHAAYVLYTSGSTGNPKGVVVEHRQLSNYIGGILARLELNEPTSFAMVSTFGADLGNTAVFAALATGGTLHMLSRDCAADPEALADYFEKHRIDALKIVPSHLHALLASPDAIRFMPRRCLILGGEALHHSLVEELRALAPACAIFNHYGPTETTVGCVCGRVAADGGHSDSVPLGTPLANVRLAIVDRRGNPCPIGVAGELLIGGAGVARGYLNRPDLTAERFVAAPADASVGRVYRSGDLVRLLPDGRLEFVGRLDDQVKIRGYRVEPGEIAALLSEHPAVRECIVLAQHAGASDARLTAYVAGGPPAPTPAELHAMIEGRLPDYMMPAEFFVMDRLPLNANGKADRAALAALSGRSAAAAGAAAPLTGVQATIGGIWCELLEIEAVRADDKFFDLGGNSLGALQVVGRLKKATGVRVTPRELLLQNLAQLATIIEGRAADNSARREPA